MYSLFIISFLASPIAQECKASHRPAHLAGVTVSDRRVDDPTYLLLADAASQPTTADSEATTRPSLRNDPRAIRWRKTIFWSAIVLFVGLVASIAIVRFSRRYAAYLKDDPPAPTASEDVWSMHRLPSDAIENSKDDEPAIDPDEPPNETDDDDNDPPPPS